VHCAACWLQLSGGQLVVVQPKLVKKQRFHFTTLRGLEVDIIAGGADGCKKQKQQ
jgi:hypothetical protein